MTEYPSAKTGEYTCMSVIIHQIFSLARDWSKYSPAKSGEYSGNVPQFSKLQVLQKKDLKNDKHNSLHLWQKYARIFVLGHYLFLEAHSFP